MTDQPKSIAWPPSPPTPLAIPTSANAPRSKRVPTATRKTHPLLGAFPLSVFALATFLVTFAVLMARLTAGVDPALHPRPTSALVAGRPGATVTTRTSGAGAAGGAVTHVAAQQRSSKAKAILVTRASGASGARVGGDD